MNVTSPPCPVCNNVTGNITLLSRKAVPTLQNVAIPTRAAAIKFPTGSLSMVRCPKCHFVWNTDFDPERISYDNGYNNDVTFSEFYIRHLEAMADRVISAIPADEPIHYVEVGCGEAEFLQLVVKRANGRCVSAIGFDPSFSGEDNLPKGAVVHKTYFGPDQLALLPVATNVIVSRHTIEHVPDVHSFVSALSASISTPERRLFIETPDADWILRHTAFQDFFYEHCSIFTSRTMQQILANYGLSAHTQQVYGSQYMWTEARLSDGAVPAGGIVGNALAEEYIANSSKLLQKWVGFIADHAKEMGVAAVIIMNPNYAGEIEAMISDMNWNPTVKVLNN